MDSLAQFVAVGKSKFGRRFIVPVDASWFDYIHNRQVLDHQEDAFSELAAQFDRIARKDDKKDPATEVWAIAGSCVIKYHHGVFMAPMCSPLTRVTAQQMTEAPYFVTEKSDGLRVVFVSIMAKFPRWTREAGGLSPLGENLYDTSQLEHGLNELQRNPSLEESSQLRLTFGVHSLRKAENGYVLCRKTAGAADGAAADEKQQATVKVRREITPRHFSYVFDRAMDVTYLLTDEYVFNRVSLVVLDGELMSTITTPPLPIIGFFDIFAYTPLQGDPHVVPISLALSKEQIVLLQRHLMSERYELLQEMVFNPFFRSMTIACRQTQAVKLFCKQMVAVAEIASSIISKIERHGKEYVFVGGPFGPTKNDGLIFTPDAFDIVSGSCEKQLKWKYPAMLTVDWVIDKTDYSAQYGLFRFSMFFKKKMRLGEPDLFGHSEFTRGARFLYPAEFKLPVLSFVAECHYDPALGAWSFVKLRPDKKDANSVVTVVSVLESQCERITLESLLNILQVDVSIESAIFGCLGGSSGAAVSAGTEPLPTWVGVPSSLVPQPRTITHFILRATSEWSQRIALTLQFLVKIPENRNTLACNHRRIEQCYGLGEPCPEEDPSSILESKLFIELANAGGSYAWSDTVCDAVFDAAKGRWVIVQVHPHHDKNVAYCTSTIQYLMDYAARQEREGSVSLPESLLAAEQQHQELRSATRCAATDEHYAERTKVLSCDTNRSNLRMHNNWIKSILIETASSFVKAERSKPQPLAVLDLCCGRGGDLPKWRHHQPRFLMMVDSCIEAVGEAAARYSIMSGMSTKVAKGHEGYPGVKAMFLVHDCFSSSLSALIDEQKKHLGSGGKDLGAPICGGFDIVSCQFSMHYAFCSEEKVRGFLSNVSNALVRGGIFVGTTVHDAVLLRRRDAARNAAVPNEALRTGQKPSTIEFGNSVYRATFRDVEATTSHGVVGEAYKIRVEESVDDAEEYVVPWKQFVHLCEKEYHLTLVESGNFTDIAERYENSEVGQRLRMIIAGTKRERDGSGEVDRISLSDDEAEAAGLFRGFLFQKA